MSGFDKVFVQASREGLGAALQAAANAANDQARLRAVRWPPADLDVVLLLVARQPEGRRQWNGGAGRGRAGETYSTVALAWWTDLIGRRHCRVVGRRGKLDPSRLDNVLSPGEDRPAVWLVYPDYFFRRGAHGRSELVALCACGRWGPPADIGWMGNCCGACHDRREEGEGGLAAWTDPGRATLSGHHGHLLFLAWSPDGGTIATGGEPGVVQLWGADGALRASLSEDNEEWLLSAAFTPDGAGAWTGSNRGVAKLWDARTGAAKAGFAAGRSVMCLALTPDGTRLAAADDRGPALWEAASGRLVHDWRGGLEEVSCLAFAPDGRSLACGSRRGTVKVWDVERGVERARLDREGACVSSLAWSPDRQGLAVGLQPRGQEHQSDESCATLLWNVGRHRVRTSLPGHRGGTRCLSFAPDGRTLASGGNDRRVALWDTVGAQERAALEWHLDSVCAVAFAPDGQTLATASYDGTAKLWPREVLPI